MVDDFVQEGMLYDKAQAGFKVQGNAFPIGFPRLAKLFGTSPVS